MVVYLLQSLVFAASKIYFYVYHQVTVIVDASEAEEFAEVASKPLRSLPYDSPGQIFGAFEKPEGVPAVGKFSNMLRFIVKEVKVLAWFVVKKVSIIAVLDRSIAP